MLIKNTSISHFIKANPTYLKQKTENTSYWSISKRSDGRCRHRQRRRHRRSLIFGPVLGAYTEMPVWGSATTSVYCVLSVVPCRVDSSRSVWVRLQRSTTQHECWPEHQFERVPTQSTRRWGNREVQIISSEAYLSTNVFYSLFLIL